MNASSDRGGRGGQGRGALASGRGAGKAKSFVQSARKKGGMGSGCQLLVQSKEQREKRGIHDDKTLIWGEGTDNFLGRDLCWKEGKKSITYVVNKSLGNRAGSEGGVRGRSEINQRGKLIQPWVVRKERVPRPKDP